MTEKNVTQRLIIIAVVILIGAVLLYPPSQKLRPGLDIAGGTLSAHLKVLKESGLIRQDKKGRWVQCSIADDDAKKLFDMLSDRVFGKDVFEADMELIRNRSQAACTPR